MGQQLPQLSAARLASNDSLAEQLQTKRRKETRGDETRRDERHMYRGLLFCNWGLSELWRKDVSPRSHCWLHYKCPVSNAWWAHHTRENGNPWWYSESIQSDSGVDLDHKSLLLSFVPSVRRSILKCERGSKDFLYSLNHTALTQRKRMVLLPHSDDEIKKERALFQYSMCFYGKRICSVFSVRHYIGKWTVQAKPLRNNHYI